MTELSVEDIRPARVMDDQRAAMQADIDWLAARRDQFEAAGCPACDADHSEFLYEKWSMPQRLCAECGTQFASPRPTEALLAEFYRRSVNYEYWAKHVFAVSMEARRERIFRPRAEAAAELARAQGLEGAVLLEVGAAYGLFCEQAAATGVFDRVIAIEPTPELASRCRGLGLETIEAPYEQVSLDDPVDMIAHFEVIEHLHAPKRFLEWCLSALRPGGVMMATCPNVAGFETLVLGREAGSVDHEHLNLFTPSSLALLARRCGFVDIEVTTPGRLDFDLVRIALSEGRVDARTLGPFLTELMRRDTPELEADVTALLQKHGLSSHMMITAKKPEAGAAS